MRHQAASWFDRASTWFLVAALAVLPFWRHRVLVHRAPEPVFFELHDFVFYTQDALWLAALGLWLLARLLADERPPWRAGPRPLWMGLAGLLALSLPGLFQAVDPPYVAYQTARLCLAFGLYLLALNARLTPGWIAGSLAAGGVIQAGLAIPQFILGHWVGLKRLGEVRFYATEPGTAVIILNGERWARAYGWTQHPNLLGGCLMVFLLVLVSYYLQRPYQEEGRGRSEHKSPITGSDIALLSVIALGLMTLLLTFSRSAWLGALLGLLAALGLLLLAGQGRALWTRRAIHLIVLALVITSTFVGLTWSGLEARLGMRTEGTEIRSVEERQTLAQGAYALIQQRPWLGVGLGNFAVALYTLARESVADYPTYQPVHAVFLLATAELGPLGGGLWLWLLIAPWWILWRGRRRVRMTPWLAAWSGALLALAAASWFDSYVWASHQGRLLQWLAWGFWAKAWSEALA